MLLEKPTLNPRPFAQNLGWPEARHKTQVHSRRTRCDKFLRLFRQRAGQPVAINFSFDSRSRAFSPRANQRRDDISPVGTPMSLSPHPRPRGDGERLKSNLPILKSKSRGFSVRDQRALHSPVTCARRGRIMENAVALASVLSLASPLRHAVSLMPFHRAAGRLPPPTQARSRCKNKMVLA